MIVAFTRIFRLHRGHVRTTKPNVRFILTGHARRQDHANSAPSSRRPQWETEIMVGSTSTTGSSATQATVTSGVATASVSAGASAAAAEEDAAASDAGAGDTAAAGAGAAAAEDAATSDADAGDSAVGVDADADGVAAHGFGWAVGAGGFGVTRGRHDDRGANTPW